MSHACSATAAWPTTGFVAVASCAVGLGLAQSEHEGVFGQTLQALHL